MILRRFLEVDGRVVHYRRFGRGPALVLLHASPVSSRVFIPMMRFWGRHFTTFAFDTPGNGLSSPLTLTDPTIADYADALDAVLQQLGIEECVVYGRHTGASIAVELAARHPNRVTLAMTDGYPVFSESQRAAYLSGYLNDLPLSADGSHLTWLWARYRDQHIFWPWNKPDAEHRADTEVPGEEFLHDGVMALLEAGNNYKAPYRAVFLHDAMAALEAATKPVCVASRPGDSLFSKLALIPDQYWKEIIPRDPQEAMAGELAIMLRHAPAAPVSADAAPVLSAGMTRQGVVVGQDQLQVVASGFGSDARPLLVLGDSPGTVLWLQDIIQHLASGRPVVAIDPAGCGESAAPGDGELACERQADRIVSVVDELGLNECDVVGFRTGANVAVEVTRRLGAKITKLVLCDPLSVDSTLRASLAAHYAVDARVRADGGHLTALWQQLRDESMWFPWFDRRPSQARDLGNAELDYGHLTQRLKDVAVHSEHFRALWASAWAYPLEARLAGLGRSAELLCLTPGFVPAASLALPEALNPQVLTASTIDAPAIASAIECVL